MEGGMDETLDEGRVARGRCDPELADSRWRAADGYFVLLWTV